MSAHDRLLHAQLEYERGFSGCGLLNVAAEFPAADAGRQTIQVHKEKAEAIVYGHLLEYRPDDAVRMQALARHLAFLPDGLMVRAGLESNSDSVKQAQDIARLMLEAL